MHLAITPGAKARLLAQKVGLLGLWALRVFTNNVTPTDATVLADLAIGAAVITPVTPAWGPAFSLPDGTALMQSGNISVAKADILYPPLVIYGWALLSTDPFLMMAQRFAGIVPKVIQAPLLTFQFRIDLSEDSLP